MQLLRRTTTSTRSLSPSDDPAEWETVRGFDDHRCRDRNRPAQVTWWLEPGQHVLVVDHTDVDDSADAAICNTIGDTTGVEYAVTLSTAGNPTRGAGNDWTDPHGLGLSDTALDRIGALDVNADTDFRALELGDSDDIRAGMRGRCPGHRLRVGEDGPRWAGIAYAPSTGKLYASPYDMDAVLIIDPMLNSTRLLTLEFENDDQEGCRHHIAKWRSIAYAPSTGKLYAAPFGAPAVLIIDPLAGTTDMSVMAGFDESRSEQLGSWCGLAHAPSTGKLYCAPHNAPQVLIIDPLRNVTDVTAMGGLGTNGEKWRGIVYAPPTGKLYCAPRRRGTLLIIDPLANTTAEIRIYEVDGIAYHDGIAFAPSTGKLYATPVQANAVLIIDPLSNATDLTAMAALGDSDTDRWHGLVFSPLTGLLYASPDTATGILVIDPLANTTDVQTFSGLGAGNRWLGIEYAPSTQKLYLAPFGADTALVASHTRHVERCANNHHCARSCISSGCGWADDQELCRGGGTTSIEALERNYSLPRESCPHTLESCSVLRAGGGACPATLTVATPCRAEQRRIQSDAATSEYFVDDFVSIPGFSASCNPSAAFEGTADPAEVFFRLLVIADNTAVDGDSGQSYNGTKMLDSSTGEMLFKAMGLAAATNYTARLIATDGYQNVTVAEWTIIPKLHSDLHLVSNGPGGRDCARGVRADAEPYDGRYECNCAGTEYTGDNCDELADSSNEDAHVIGASLGSVLIVIAAVAIAFRVQVYRLKHRPIDMDAVQAEVLDELGLGISKSIGDHEFGVLLTMRTALDATVIVEERHVKQLTQLLVKALPKLSAELAIARVTVVEQDRAKLVLVVQRPRRCGVHSDIAERTAATISKQVQTRSLSIVSTEIIAAALAVPRRTPREIDRRWLTRMDHLGAGAFGEVDLYWVDESKQRRVPPYKVAAKTIKPGATAGRDELLREAALMALLDHRNLLALVGVVTTPRSLPALILLAYCEGGELLKRLRNGGSGGGLNTTKKLTYAAQIALGMQYLSTRNVVHRDLAARNVLLDAMGICKVADFGMSTSLVRQDKTYAAEYIKIHAEMALRWAAPEALANDRFSVASDVWAYGVTVWEIFSAGVDPYSECGLAEVGAFVKSGGRLKLPMTDCPEVVFDALMQPCWATDPSARPGFARLYDAAVANGALEDAATLETRAIMRKRVSAEAAASAALRHQVAGHQANTLSVADRTLLAPSVHHIQAILVPKTVAAIRAIRKGKGHEHQAAFDLLDGPMQASIWHMVHAYAKPASENTACPRDGRMGSAYVDTLVDEADVGRATALLSYSWGYKVAEVSAALSSWAGRTSRSLTHTYIWICSLCLNQYRLGVGESATPEDLAAEFGDRVIAIGRILPLLEPWDDPGYVKRAWCLFELYTAIRLHREVDVDIILSPKQAQAFRAAMVSKGYSVVDGALQQIHAESATASVKADLEAIRDLIRGYPGGFETLNETVKQRLQQWFESQGGIKVKRSTLGDHCQGTVYI